METLGLAAPLSPIKLSQLVGSPYQLALALALM